MVLGQLDIRHPYAKTEREKEEDDKGQEQQHLDTDLTPFTKTDLQWLIDLNRNAKPIKLLRR